MQLFSEKQNTMLQSMLDVKFGEVKSRFDVNDVKLNEQTSKFDEQCRKNEGNFNEMKQRLNKIDKVVVPL